MRTTLAIDDDVLEAAKTIARQQRSTIGAVLSDLARRTLERQKPLVVRNGITLLPTQSGSVAVTLEMVNELRGELP